ncbi:hypothetical protein, partial [Halobacillus sp. BBL2006]|uniref:hypothetical protein n=1 Tax=Halobacillus sp. BBL2006 TaxID=1543706 RepID=UPI00054453E8
MSGVKFYSEYDMICGGELEKIIKKINNEDINSVWSVNDLLDFHNVMKYMRVERFCDIIVQEASVDIPTYEKKIKQKIG